MTDIVANPRKSYLQICYIRFFSTGNKLLNIKNKGMIYMKQPVNKITKEDLIEDVLKVFNETQNTTQSNYLKHGQYSKAPIKRIFGSWNKMLQELNYDINMYKGEITKEDVLKDMYDLINRFGYVNSKIQREHGKYSQIVIDKLFGSWTNLAIVLNQKIDGRQISDEDIKQNLLDINDLYGGLSTYLLDNYCIVSRQTIAARFGSVSNICNELGISYLPPTNTSKLCNFVLEIITEELNEEPILEYTFDWLVNPNTDCHLRLDAYYPNHNLAVEVDGKQHFYNSDLFGPCDIQQERDKIKNHLLQEHNIHLIRIKYSDDIKTIKTKIKPFI